MESKMLGVPLFIKLSLVETKITSSVYSRCSLFVRVRRRSSRFFCCCSFLARCNNRDVVHVLVARNPSKDAHEARESILSDHAPLEPFIYSSRERFLFSPRCHMLPALPSDAADVRLYQRTIYYFVGVSFSGSAAGRCHMLDTTIVRAERRKEC